MRAGQAETNSRGPKRRANRVETKRERVSSYVTCVVLPRTGALSKGLVRLRGKSTRPNNWEPKVTVAICDQRRANHYLCTLKASTNHCHSGWHTKRTGNPLKEGE